VRCWPDGRLLIQGAPNLPGACRHEEELQLPLLAGQKLHPRSAQALFTDTGRLYVRVEVTVPPPGTEQGLGPVPSQSDLGSHMHTLTAGFA
jgi:hypothetical protein